MALPVVHIILMTREGQLRLVQRGDKPENPYMWDKAVGGHVVWQDPALPLSAFEANVHKEMAEEIGLHKIEIAANPLDFIERLHGGGVDLQQQVLLRMIDYDPWQGVMVQVKAGQPWVKRLNVAVYAGFYEGPMQFVDGEAIATCSVDPHALRAALIENPWRYSDGLRVVIQRYLPLLLVGTQQERVAKQTGPVKRDNLERVYE